MIERKDRLTLEEIITLVEEARYREADLFLDVSAIKRAKPAAVSRMLMELMPLKTRTAKAMSARILTYGRLDAEQKDQSGYTLIGKAVELQRTDILNALAEKLRKRDLKNKNTEEDRTALMEYLLDHQQKIKAVVLLKKGILRYIEKENRKRLIRKIIRYKDETMLGAVLKCEKELEPSFLPLPGNASERQFMHLILEKYTKYIDLDNDRAYLWEVAFACEAEEIMCLMLKKKEDYQYLARIAGGSDEIFQVLDTVRPGKVLMEVRKEVLVSAFSGSSGKDRFAYLAENGWARGERRKEDISILDDMREKIKGKRYGSSRKAQREKVEDQNKLNYLARYEAERTGYTQKA